MPTLVCRICGLSKDTTQFKLDAGQKYCGRLCKSTSQKIVKTPNRTELACLICGKLFIVPKAWIREGRRKFCGKECRTKHQKTLKREKAARFGKTHTQASRDKIARTRKIRGSGQKGPNHSQWRGGRMISGAGYVSVMIDMLPLDQQVMARRMRPMESYILEHRLVMAMELRRPLLRSEVVHHKNGVKDDNRPENLAMVDWTNHSREHREIERELTALRSENQALKFWLLIYLRNGLVTLNRLANM